jgi:hypothetical protein
MAGPMLLNVKAGVEMFFNESCGLGSLLLTWAAMDSVNKDRLNMASDLMECIVVVEQTI